MNEIKIQFSEELTRRLNAALACASADVAEAALAAVAQDKKVTVRAFASALRDAAPCLGTSTCVLAAAVKAAKEKDATLDDVAQAMAQAFLKKRADDRKRAADKRDEAPGKALQKAQAKVNECKLAMRSPLQVAIDEVTAAEARVREAARVLREERAKLRKARAKLAEIEPAEQKEQKEQTEQAA